MKQILIYFSILFFLFTANLLYAGGWHECGKLSQIKSSCQLPTMPIDEYEYGIKYNSTEAMPVNCTFWNKSRRVFNKQPYLTYSDNPQSGMKWGGFVFYTETNASDDNNCGTKWRHHYWTIGSDNKVSVEHSNGCNDPIIYCRER